MGRSVEMLPLLEAAMVVLPAGFSRLSLMLDGHSMQRYDKGPLGLSNLGL